MSDLDAIAEDIEMAARSPEMARHVALDHGPELIAELKGLRAEVGLLRGGYNVRPMTEVESNLMTEVLDLRRENGRLRGHEESIRQLHRRGIWTATGAFYCVHCRPSDVRWPCKTIAALDAEPIEED